MKANPKISDAEWEVMEVIWDRHPLPASEVFTALRGRRDWSEGTVKTLLNRLLKKGALGHETEGKRYRYFPRVSRASCVRAETRSFMDRVFGGSVSPMLAQFVEQSDLSAEEIAELKRLLEDKEG